MKKIHARQLTLRNIHATAVLFATFTEEEILAANKAVLPTSTRKRQVWLMSLSTFG